MSAKKVRIEMEIEEFQGRMPCPAADSCKVAGIGCNFFVAQNCESAQEALVIVSACSKKPIAFISAKCGSFQECLS